MVLRRTRARFRRLVVVPAPRSIPSRKALVAGVAGLFTAAVLLLSSCGSLQKNVVTSPQIPGASYVGNKVCYECHTNITRIFPANQHGRIHVETALLKGETGCES